MVVLLVSLVLGEDSRISQLAAGARYEPPVQHTEMQWVEGSNMGDADATSAPTPDVNLPDPHNPPISTALPEPEYSQGVSQLPRMELLYLD